MDLEALVEAAAARLRAAGVSRETAETLAARIAGALEHLQQQAELLPASIEPATVFAAGFVKPQT